MKKYKTWEAIKMLTENPNLKFQTKEIDENITTIIITIYINEEGYLDIIEKGCYDGIDGNLNPNDEWELVQKEVNFMDAIKALDAGKSIYCIYNEDKFGYNPDSCTSPKYGNTPSGLTTKEILEGHWYIQEDEETND